MDLKSGYPFWLMKNGVLCTYPSLQKDIRCDVAIIGGGITGALIAYHLTKAGFDTVVLDKRLIGWGSTCATTALLQYEIDTPLCDLIEMVGEDHAVRSYQACLAAIDKLAQVAQAVKMDCGFVAKKSLYVASYQKDVAALKREYAVRKRYGLPSDWLDQQAIEALFSFSRPAALLSTAGAQVDAYRFTHGLLQTAMESGLQVFTRTEVKTIDQRASCQIGQHLCCGQ
jgi:glycine/D-amino acid oxidase-like deaminating enzyme